MANKKNIRLLKEFEERLVKSYDSLNFLALAPLVIKSLGMDVTEPPSNQPWYNSLPPGRLMKVPYPSIKFDKSKYPNYKTDKDMMRKMKSDYVLEYWNAFANEYAETRGLDPNYRAFAPRVDLTLQKINNGVTDQLSFEQTVKIFEDRLAQATREGDLGGVPWIKAYHAQIAHLKQESSKLKQDMLALKRQMGDDIGENQKAEFNTLAQEIRATQAQINQFQFIGGSALILTLILALVMLFRSAR